MSTSTRFTANQTNIILFCLYFLLATTWLFAPLVNGNEYGSLRFISNYEGHGQVWSWLFRAGDITSSALLALLVYRFRIWRKDRLMAVLLLVIAALAAIDSIFAVDCKAGIVHYCHELTGLSTTAHDQESTISVFVIGAAIIWDIWKRRRPASIVFLLVQIVFGILAEIQPFAGQKLAILQYLYQILLTLWLIYALEGMSPKGTVSPAVSLWFRRIFAYWVGASGVMTIITAAAHLRLFDPNLVLYFGDHAPWVAPQAVFFGVLMLYLARQIYQGQRRAAYLLLVLLLFEIIKYSLIEPDPPLLIIYLLAFISLFVLRGSFRRNIRPITIHRRVLDFATLLSGVVAALAIITILLAATGRLHHTVRIIENRTGYVSQQYHHRAFLQSRRTRTALDVLGLATLGVGLWALFRPGGMSAADDQVENAKTARRLLERHSRSSEDFFKLWPPDKRYFFGPESHGFIAYRLISGTAFALDGPIARNDAACRRLLQTFCDFCEQQGWSVCFLGVTEPSKPLYTPRLNLQRIGSSAVIDIATFNAKTRHDKWWRWQYNRATKAGLTYHVSQPPHSDSFMQELKTVSDAWLSRPGHREQSFALGYFDEAYLQQCTVHYLRDATDKLVAFTNQVPVFGGQQTTVDLMRFLPDHDGAMPFLLLSVINVLGEMNEYVTFDLGFVPLAQVHSRSAQLIKTITRHRFSAAGLEQFKGKFKPDWQPAYIAYSGDIIDLASLAIKLEAAFKREVD